MEKQIDEMNVPELRKEAGRRNLGTGVWRAGAGRDALLAALRGESVPAAPAAPSGLEAMLAAAIEPHLASRTISRDEFTTMADAWVEQADAIEKLTARVAELETNGSKGGGAALRVSFDAPAGFVGVVDGLAHRQLGQVVAWVAAGVPLWLHGGAGGGKTTLARQVATALGLPVVVIPIDETVTISRLLGFRNMATGEFVAGPMLAPYRDGGVLMLDEIDTGNPGIIAALNSLLANNHYTFPDGVEYTRHANFRVIAGANTKGTGSIAGYTARNRLDAATLNRFAVLELALDEGLEMALVCGGKNESVPWTCGGPLNRAAAEVACASWVNYVQKVRGTGSIAKRVLISPRASLLGAAGLRQGIPVAEVADACLFALCDADTKAAIVNACGEPPKC